MKLTAALRMTALTMFLILLAQGALWGAPYPLAKIPVPEPANLSEFVKDKGAAIRLGKALFWDMQAGSDGVQACASCHFSAGADNRLTNQLHPGPAVPPAALPAFEIGTGPNYTLLPQDFPFFQVSPVDGRLGIDPLTGLPADPDAVVVRDLNDVGGSQGITLSDFLAINAGSPLESGSATPSPVFGAARQVTGRNAPSVINAVFNYTNFWDGRANNIFNGENPLGPLDQNAGIWVEGEGGLVKQRIAIANASLASQATGPPLSSVEMSYVGRSFPELGRKMLSLTPLGTQLVHPADSVLGALARGTLQADGSVAGGRGLNSSYPQMIRDAFQDAYWDSSSTVTLPAGPGEPEHRFSQMEANFSLFWGLAVQLYEATLVSDQTPFDRFVSGNSNALTLSAQSGLATFVDKCAVCHAGTEFSTAVVGSNTPLCTPPDCNRSVFSNNTSHRLIQAGLTVSGGLSDTGFFNIGVRPTTEDPGRGGVIGLPLSFSRLAQLRAQGDLPFATPKLPVGVSALTPADVAGAFKTPGLRNVELTAPYFHNGSMLTLEQMVEFYTRGGNSPSNPELALAMQPIRNLRGNVQKRDELVEFLKALTDERVRAESAPFDHPELLVPSGDAADSMIVLAPTGGGPAAVAPALTLAPVVTPTALTSQTLSGTVDESATVEVQVNALAPAFATVTGSAWSLTLFGLPVGANSIGVTATTPGGGRESLSAALVVLPVAAISGVPPGGRTAQNSATLTIGGAGVTSYRYSFDGGAFSADLPVATPIVLAGLADATHTVTVLGEDAAGNRQQPEAPTTVNWTVKVAPPVLTLAPVSSPTRIGSQTIGGSVELGSIPSVTVASPAQAGPVRTVGGNGIAAWSCEITGLAEGVNDVTVRALDFVFNATTVSGAITLDTVAPALTVSPAGNPIRVTETKLLGGTVEAGLTPVLTAPDGAVVGPVAVTGSDWSCLLSGLLPGANEITVSAADPAGNLTSLTATVPVFVADGNFKQTGSADLSDALKALRMAVGLVPTAPLDLLYGDVAPLVNGSPAPDGRIDLADALTILKKVVGSISF